MELTINTCTHQLSSSSNLSGWKEVDYKLMYTYKAMLQEGSEWVERWSELETHEHINWQTALI